MPSVKKITKPGQLPVWFNIKNYVPAEKFTLVDWYVNFLARTQAYARDQGDRI